jgi:tRNA-dihydrouridine synthase
MTDDPDKYRSDMRKKLLELANSMPLAPMAAARDKKVRGLARETVENLLINQRPN